MSNSHLLYYKVLVPCNESMDPEVAVRLELTQEVTCLLVTVHGSVGGTKVLERFEIYEREAALEHVVLLALGMKADIRLATFVHRNRREPDGS